MRALRPRRSPAAARIAAMIIPIVRRIDPTLSARLRQSAGSRDAGAPASAQKDKAARLSEGVVFRPVWEDERPRALKAFAEAAGIGTGGEGCFVALRLHPVERMVGAVFWREKVGEDGQSAIELRWQLLPSLAGGPLERDLLLAFIEEMDARAPAAPLQTADALPEGPSCKLLQECGFRPAYRDVRYVLGWEGWTSRTRHLLTRRGRPLPPQIRVLSPDTSHAEALRALVCREHRLLTEQAVEKALTALGAPLEFLARYSALVLAGERLIGVCLARVAGPTAEIPVLLVDQGGGLARGLVCALLFDQCQAAMAREGIRAVTFRADPRRSPAIARLARRFGARELGVLTAFRRGNG